MKKVIMAVILSVALTLALTGVGFAAEGGEPGPNFNWGQKINNVIKIKKEGAFANWGAFMSNKAQADVPFADTPGVGDWVHLRKP